MPAVSAVLLASVNSVNSVMTHSLLPTFRHTIFDLKIVAAIALAFVFDVDLSLSRNIGVFL